MSDKQRVDREKLQHSLRCIMSDFGVVDAPVDGCPVRDSDPTRDENGPADTDDKVRQVTERVMAQLRQKGIA